MASVVKYFIDSLEDFVFLAYESPLLAILIVVLIASLAFSRIWARWFARLQQPAPLKVIDVDDAVQGANGGGDRLPKNAPDIQPSPNNLRNGKKKPTGGRARFSSVASPLLNQSQRTQHGPMGLQQPPFNLVNASNPSGNNLASLSLRSRGRVSFYPSTSPSHRGTIDSTSDNEVLPLRQHEVHTNLDRFDSSSVSTPSEASQDAVDAQLFDDQSSANWDQIRVEERQLRADMNRMSQRLTFDIQRVDSYYRAQMRRVEEEMRDMDEDMQNINWDIS